MITDRLAIELPSKAVGVPLDLYGYRAPSTKVERGIVVQALKPSTRS
jgi:hypothetical protein